MRKYVLSYQRSWTSAATSDGHFLEGQRPFVFFLRSRNMVLKAKVLTPSNL